MLVTFLFLKYLESPTPYRISYGKRLLSENVLQTNTVTLGIMTVFSMLRMRTGCYVFVVQIQCNSCRLREL